MITACLSWFDEPVELLERCIGSLAGVADHVVALDGRWSGFPGERTNSSRREHDAIAAAAAAIGVDATVEHAREVWPDQVAKRSALLELAPPVTGWFLIIDADEHIWSCDRAALERALEATDADVASMPLTNLAAKWPRAQLPEHTYTVRRLFRAAAQPRYETAHNGVRGPGGVWLSGDRRHVELAPALDVGSAIAFGHACDARPTDRHRQRSIYYRTRNQQRIEDWTAVA